MRSKYTSNAKCCLGKTRSPKERWRTLLLVCISELLIVFGYGGAVHAATKLQVLVSFGHSRREGLAPFAPVVDAKGNLYVTLEAGGARGGGAVVELSPPAPGATAWTKRLLYSFPGPGGGGGSSPGGLMIDAAGNLYGTATGGGAHGYGVVFELSPPMGAKKAWKETVLHDFYNDNGGAYPGAALVEDDVGNLYGTTEGGGAHHLGVVFELSPPVGDKKAWKETVINAFRGEQNQVYVPGVILGAEGNLYATTEGGPRDYGVAYEFSPPVAGQARWQKTILHRFEGVDGENPSSPLFADAAGNLYGTAANGGAHDCGLVFELSPPGPGETQWNETVLHAFDNTRGCVPLGGVIADSAGNLYGTTLAGSHREYGVVFELRPPTVGATTWNETVLHRFNRPHGYGAMAGLATDGSGALYGTTEYGGKFGGGIVFKLTP